MGNFQLHANDAKIGRHAIWEPTYILMETHPMIARAAIAAVAPIQAHRIWRNAQYAMPTRFRVPLAKLVASTAQLVNLQNLQPLEH